MNRRRPLCLLFALLALSVPFGVVADVAGAADGAPDPSFGDGGQTTSDPTALNEDPEDAVLDAQGRTVVVFAGFPKESGADQAFVARYLPNGEIDKSFGSGGISRIPWTTEKESETPTGVTIDGKGRIVVGGEAVKGTVRGFDFAAARFFQNGVLDPSFGEGGVATLDIPGDGFDLGRAVAVDSQNRVLVAGIAIKPGGTETASSMTVVRWTETGAPDPTFGENGIAKVNRNGSPLITAAPIQSSASAIAVDGAGRIFVGGSAGTGERFIPVVARLSENGSPDAGFGVGGVVPVTLSEGATGSVGSLALSGGEIVVAGDLKVGENEGFGVARLLASGAPDPSFAGGGPAVTTKAGAELSTHDLTLDSAGRVIVAGTVQEPLVTSAALFRFTPAGTLDPAFGSAGVVRTNFSAAFAVGDTPLVDAAGRYLLVGSGSDVSTRVLGFARFLNSSAAVAAPAPTPAPIAPAPPAPKPKCGGRTATIVGTPGADHLKGTKKADVIVGLGGNDTIKGLGGNDLICAGAGADKVFGGPGADRILGEGGKDQLFGGPGADALLGGAGADTLVGGPGKDQEVGGPGKDEQR
ncbi:MAG TPA: hypothetical protein VHZ54_17750 [Solirubrobacterales bacterium]|nr:hypothetical protein [Solirubrobacterales bacterium]